MNKLPLWALASVCVLLASCQPAFAAAPIYTDEAGHPQGAKGQICVDPLGNTKDCAAAVVVATTSRSGTITLGGTAQNAMAANTSRKGWCVQNPTGASESLFVRAGGTASSSTGTELAAGQQACNQPGTVDQGAISVFAATTSHAFSAFETQ